ncbi:MAG: DUF2628 domain-containing protein [Desulfuromonadaceae bacterium]|nr:DUF2628 domain-containing protein [Desulfuromonadaceae bacterium]
MLNLDPASSSNIDSISSDEVGVFVGDNASYYIQIFSKFTISGRERFCVTWNWSTFGFTFLWMLYRKMYILALVTFVAFCIPGINIILHIVVGMVGNYLYYRHVKEKIVEIRSTQSPQNFYPVLREMGGVNRWVISLAVIISIMLGLLFIFFFAAISAYLGHFAGLAI